MNSNVPSARWILPGTLDRVAPLVRQVEAWLLAHGLSGRTLHTAQLALEEIVANAVEHAGDGPRRIEVRVALDGDDVHLTVQDDGLAFDPLRQAPVFDRDAPLEARRGGGMGLHLVRSLVDQWSYVREGGTNRLDLRVTRKAG